MTSPFPLVATRDPATRTIPLNQLPVGVAGGIASYDEFTSSNQTILDQATLVATDVVTDYRMTIANAMPGALIDVYCRGGVQPVRSTITTRTDVYLAYCMPDVPVIGGAYGIEGDGHRPVLIPDAMCDAQGLT